jgi:hypothetical protein
MRQIRSGAGWLHLLLAAAVILAVLVQVYLIGAYFFGAGQGALDAHKSIGFAVHGVEVLVLVVALIAWLPRTDILLSLTLAVIGTIQIALASAHKWAGGLHPLFAMAVLALATLITVRRVRARRTPAPPAPA